MLEQRIRVVSEGLARALDRRTFLRRAGGSLVSGVTALALGTILSSSHAQAAIKGDRPMATPSCVPPGPYCNTGGGDLTGCHGGHCFHHLSGGNVVTCTIMTSFYQVGCWTTVVTGGYWTCCDCQCSDFSTCGCAQFSQDPSTIGE
jgi:hypothetical protein